MKEGEEEKILLSSLGVTSANVEDVERKFLSEAQEDPNLKDTSEGQEPGEELDESFIAQKKLQNNLRTVQLEIEAVASGLDKGKSVNSNSDEKQGEGKEESDEGKIGSSKSLQKALVTDRLKSLEKVKSQIKRKLSEFGEGPSKREKSKEKELIQSLVKEKPMKNKGIMKTEVKNSGTTTKKRVKIVSISEDTEFDAILDAASSGFMETEREKLVRKGILTPFHSLRGFERRVQTTTRTRIDTDSPSARQNAVMNEEDLAEQESIARLTRSMAEIARSRPTTKLMDPDQLPRLDPPTAPFLRMRTGSKGPASGREDEIWGERVKRRRPLPDKKWRKEKLVKGPGDDGKDETSADSDAEEYEPDIVLEGGLNIPSKIYNQLFDYQKIGVQWLWELHCQKAGGIIGDEMGLGKTIQVLSFLASLHHSRLYQPSIIVCPVTLLRQWEREAETWYPHFHVEILHDSAYVQPLKKKTKNSDDEDEDKDEDSDSDDDADYEEENENEKKRGFKRNPKKWDELIKRVLDSDSGLLITTYEQLRILGEKLLDVNWGYAILDEGHRIRNPNAEVTLICKQFRTLHRVIMTGAPIQNKLAELWSLFDFVFPGKLGVLPVFEAEFSVPITVGGYVNANPLQVSTAYRCAVVLRDLIMPYLLRRMKADVDAQLPNKTEHVLFCSLLPEQRAIYRNFLASSDVEQIFDGRKSSFGGIDIMKKICNHPDLLERESSERNPDYGNINRSGKLKVVEQIFRVWKEQGHRVLLFAQTQQMLDIIEEFLVSEEYIYRRMDGKTPVKQRMALIDEFNNSSEIFVFILTTKVGGLGTNLTGANRIIIYDPDWNPSTDMQARERAWRIGQKKDVTVYRLITRGTIEEKIYQRQIYKHFLTNKVLKDARQKRLFTQKDMKDLYTLQDDVGTTETSNIFGQLSEDVNIGVQNAKDGISNGESSDQGGEEPVKENGETNILKSLFNAHGIHSAMNHDAIMNVNEDQKVRMEKEANQVAQRAAEALRQSRRNRVREDFAVPTWTGRSGSAGAPPGARGRFGSAVPRARPVCPEASRSRAPMMTALPVGGVGVNNRRALSSSDVLHRIRGTHSSAVSDAMETDSLPPARLVSPEASRSGRLLMAVPVGGSTSSDTSSEASRRRVALTALPVRARSANRVDSDSSSGASRSRFATAVPVGHGANRRMTGGTHASAGRSRSRVITQPEVLIRKICTFLQGKGGSASSVSITEYFQDMVRPEDANLFKGLLKEIATLKKGANGSKWFLKSGYEN